jgi:hypothetical protein
VPAGTSRCGTPGSSTGGATRAGCGAGSSFGSASSLLATGAFAGSLSALAAVSGAAGGVWYLTLTNTAAAAPIESAPMATASRVRRCLAGWAGFDEPTPRLELSSVFASGSDRASSGRSLRSNGRSLEVGSGGCSGSPDSRAAASSASQNFPQSAKRSRGSTASACFSTFSMASGAATPKAARVGRCSGSADWTNSCAASEPSSATRPVTASTSTRASANTSVHGPVAP